MSREIRLLLAAGGTGGHLFPGVAVADVAQREFGARVLFVGTQHGMEKDIIPSLGFALRFIPAEQLRGRNWGGMVRALWAACRAVGVAWRIVREFSPDVIFSIGGYASGPTVLVGWVRRIPCVLLEPNAIPGMTNKWLGRLATKICLGFPQVAAYFPAHKAVWTGNPVRWKTGTEQQPNTQGSASQHRLTILIFGGSAGAHRLNSTLPQALALVGKGADVPRIVHQTGKADYAKVVAAYKRLSLGAEVIPFIETMREYYMTADLVICRAGAITLAELTALGKPAILIPYPYAVDDHQRANAEILVHAGAARMVVDTDLTPERIAQEIRSLIADRETLHTMSRAALTLGRPDATAAVIRECLACLPPHVRPVREAVCQ